MEGYEVRYEAEDWSLEFSGELPEGTKAGDSVDLGTWRSIDEWLEGILPGRYTLIPIWEGTPRPEEKLVIVVGGEGS